MLLMKLSSSRSCIASKISTFCGLEPRDKCSGWSARARIMTEAAEVRSREDLFKRQALSAYGEAWPGSWGGDRVIVVLGEEMRS